jgi:hypothetical protein
MKLGAPRPTGSVPRPAPPAQRRPPRSAALPPARHAPAAAQHGGRPSGVWASSMGVALPAHGGWSLRCSHLHQCHETRLTTLRSAPNPSRVKRPLCGSWVGPAARDAVMHDPPYVQIDHHTLRPLTSPVRVARVCRSLSPHGESTSTPRPPTHARLFSTIPYTGTEHTLTPRCANTPRSSSAGGGCRASQR